MAQEVKSGTFTGSIRLWEGMVFAKLSTGDTVILGNSVADAKALVGCTIKYHSTGEERFSVDEIVL